MSISVIIFVIYILVRVVMAFASDDDELPANVGDLTLFTEVRMEECDDGESLEVYQSTINGSVLVPYADIKCRLIYQITDITDSENHLPVVCRIDDFTDGESPFFHFQVDLTLEYQCSGISGMEMPTVPRQALLLPHRGKRRLKLAVFIIDADDEEVYACGEAFVNAEQESHGFLELGQRDTETDYAIAALALTICAGDGHIDKRETAVIKRYFREQFAGEEDDDLQERKDKLNEAMRELLTHAKDVVATMSPAEITAEIHRRAMVITEFESEALNQAAYQLVVQIVAADDVVEEAELEMLRDVVAALGIAEEVDTEIRDRHLKLAMFESQDHSAALNMPAKLSDEEQKEFLNLEYEKWRRRATHTDPKVREEATTRLAAVTKARRELEDG